MQFSATTGLRKLANKHGVSNEQIYWTVGRTLSSCPQ